MTPLDKEYQTQIVSDLNCLARMAALENAWETRGTAALMAELYRYRKRDEGEPVELAAELRAVELCLRLITPRYGIDCSWEFSTRGLESILVPRGDVLKHVETLISRCVDVKESIHVRIQAVQEAKNCVILLEEGSGRDHPLRIPYPL